MAEAGIVIFKMGVIVAAPIILVIFIVDFGFGLLNKIAEQVNVFQLSFQVKPTVSMIIILGISPVLADRIMGVFEEVMLLLNNVLIVMQG